MTGSAGGMAQKTFRVLEALESAYHVRGISDPQDIRSQVVFVEPLRITLDFTGKNKDPMELVKTLADKKVGGCKIVLYCSELAMIKMQPKLRHEVLRLADAITVNCDFQRQLFRYINVTPAERVCDPIPDVFRKAGGQASRELKIVAAGNIAYNKNSDMVIEVYKALEGSGVKRTYLGSSQLWAAGSKQGVELNDQMQEHTDEFISCGTMPEVANQFKTAIAGLWLSHHDCFAQTAHEMAMAGLPLISGDHGLADELPVYKIVSSVAEAVSAVHQLADNTDVDEWDEMSVKISDWAQDRVSYDAFLSQVRSVIRKIA